MGGIQNIITDIEHFFGMFDMLEGLVISINLLLMVFAKRILKVIYHEAETSSQFKMRVNIFRLFNLLIIIAFTVYHMPLSVSPDTTDKGVAYKIVTITITLYLSYVGLHVMQYFIRLRYGKSREIDGRKQVIETYNSRLFNIFAGVFVFVIALVSIIRILGYDSLLEAGGAIGLVGVFLALTQNAWAPDVFSGLIILNSGMVEVGDVIEFNDADKTLGMVYKTKVFHTEILNLVNNHRIMIKNSRLRDHTIHNLSKFASAKGLREQLHFKIDYTTDEDAVHTFFEDAFQAAIEDKDIGIESQYPVEVGVVDAGDHAVEWCVYYYTKDVRNIMKIRQRFRELILRLSKKKGISLATPLQHVITQLAAK